MAPILKEMEKKLKAALLIFDIEIPSYVDDITVVITYTEQKDMSRINNRVAKVIEEVAERHGLSLTKIKKKTIVFRNRKRNRKEVDRVKWLGIIYDATLIFDHHWKSRVAKAKALLG